MIDAASVAKRVLWWRFALWLAALLLAALVFAVRYPLALFVAGLGVLVTLLWPLARHLLALTPSDTLEGEREKAKGESEQGTEDSDQNTHHLNTRTPEYLNTQHPLFAFRLSPFAFEVGLDLLLVTALIAVSGGFTSAFAPLLFLVVVETFALLGPVPALYAALAAVLLNLIHFRTGITAQAAALYATATGALLLSAVLVAWSLFPFPFSLPAP